MSSIEKPLFTETAHLTKLKADVRAGSTDSLREVARQFESMFTHMLMKNMRAASLGDGAFDSDQSRFYQDMFDQQMSTELTEGKGLGIADLLVEQLGGSGNDTVKPVSAFPLSLPIPQRGSVSDSNAVPVSETKQSGHIDAHQSKQPVDFIREALPHARRVGKALGVAPQLILAQAVLETGWGKKTISNADGSNSNNVFGVKTGSSWTGSKAIVNTLEFSAGVGRRVKAAFRSYTSLADSFDDYAQLLLNSSRYKDALGSGDDSAAFAGALKRGGYATDPDYDKKILRIANGETLRNAIEVTSQGTQ